MESANIIDSVELDPALQAEINRIGRDVYFEELQKAFIQASVAIAYEQAVTSTPRGLDGRDPAIELDRLAAEIAAERLVDLDLTHSRNVVAFPHAAGDKRARETGRMPLADGSEHATRSVGTAALAEPFGAKAKTVTELAASWAANTAQQELVLGKAELLRQLQVREQEAQREQAFRALHAQRQRALELQRTQEAQRRNQQIRTDQQQRRDEEHKASERWNDLAAAAAYARTLRAQSEIARGGDPTYWEGYALRDASMARGLRAPQRTEDGWQNGATTQRYQRPVTIEQRRFVQEEAREQQTTTHASTEARVASGYGLESAQRDGVERTDVKRTVTERSVEHSFEHRFEPIHAPGSNA